MIEAIAATAKESLAKGSEQLGKEIPNFTPEKIHPNPKICDGECGPGGPRPEILEGEIKVDNIETPFSPLKNEIPSFDKDTIPSTEDIADNVSEKNDTERSNDESAFSKDDNQEETKDVLKNNNDEQGLDEGNHITEQNEQRKSDVSVESRKNEQGQSSDLQNEADGANVDAVVEGDTPDKQGGSYGDVFKEGEGDKFEVHHMPADSASNLERNDGPAIKMEKEDHRETASCGSSKEAREYREAQKELIDQGKFREALQMDIDDIHEKFGDKYDDAIAEMLEYVDKIEEEGKLHA